MSMDRHPDQDGLGDLIARILGVIAWIGSPLLVALLIWSLL
jgi:hypothetical protein